MATQDEIREWCGVLRTEIIKQIVDVTDMAYELDRKLKVADAAMSLGEAFLLDLNKLANPPGIKPETKKS